MFLRRIAGPSRRLHSKAYQSKSPATTERPDLTPSQQKTISRIIRVDQAGELGANWIYRGQKWGSILRGDMRTANEVQAMWETEKHHLETMKKLQTQHRVRPTALWPVWQGMAFGIGAVTALMGREAAMACTEAVETVIGEHYDDQIKSMKSIPTDHPSIPLLSSILVEFRDEELEHLDHAVEHGAQKAPGHALLSAAIGLGCKAAIKVCEKI